MPARIALQGLRIGFVQSIHKGLFGSLDSFVLLCERLGYFLQSFREVQMEVTQYLYGIEQLANDGLDGWIFLLDTFR